ncbi:alkaline phosphatase family protein [Gaoshiqia sediminis]|uniref:Alkaline phosphatase family protein n=1 Tax=Gaoshiqia sediminis TaxID=2986998 RepID=A0AA41Y6F7_9BACT|nr:alkaline phosphatase family protein [Gaoshiqia sediminis]MCW0481987.1 alkaline phosphatase family protein [Gaoshiqia sediminis]
MLRFNPIFLLFLILFAGNFVSAQSSKIAAANPPRLVVVINVEQMRTDYLSRYADKFQQDGFLRLVNQGAVCSNASMNLHVKKCLTGVPTLFTGVYPDRHGIINESWYDRLKEKEINALDDSYYMTVGSDSPEGQRSAALLLSPTLGDVLKLNTNGKSRVFSVGLNDYSAVFSAGHAADGAYWLDNQTGHMISSSYYVGQFPAWAFDFNNKGMAGMYIGRDWTTLLPISSYGASLNDDYVLEKGYYDKWNTFPYNLKKLMSNAGSYKVLKTTPFGNRMIKDFAVNLIESEQLGRDEVPDLLTISFSSMDYENSSFGPSSVEMQDIYLRLDQDIASLLTYLDKAVGMTNTLVVLTSACSASYPVTYLKEEFNMPVGYVAPESMIALLKSFLNITYGQGDWIEFVSDQQIYMNRQLIEKKGLALETVQAKAASFINQFEGVKLALPASDFTRGDYVKSQLMAIAKSYNLKRSGDVLYVLEDGWQPQFKYHRTIYNDNSRIPLIWLGSSVKNTRILDQVDAIDMVPTIFEILGFDVPGHCEGRILEEILR